MSVVPFPERRYSPDMSEVTKLLKTAEEEGGAFFELAELAIGRIQEMRREERADLTPADVKTIATCLAIAWFALGRELGVPLETLIDLDEHRDHSK